MSSNQYTEGIYLEDGTLKKFKDAELTATVSSHTGNKSNPHSVTKSQVGLGNVPNVATNDQTPTFSAASELATLTSGEKLSVSMGKIMKAITDLISHIGDTVKHITSTERTNWNAAKTHADSAHAPSGAQANVIETVKVNGTALTPSSKAVNISVPSVGNGTVTIKQNGTTKGSFTMNQSGNATIELTDSNDNTTYSDMTGATSSAAGKHGLVPAPAAGKQGQFLRGDGTWATPDDEVSYVLEQDATNSQYLRFTTINDDIVASNMNDRLNTLESGVSELNSNLGSKVIVDGERKDLRFRTLYYDKDCGELPYAFYNGSAVVYNYDIHILGTNNNTTDCKKHYKWNGVSWTSASTLPDEFKMCPAVVYNNEIHILGTFNDDASIDNHYKWNGSSWTGVSILPYYPFLGSAVVYNNEIHMIGSRDHFLHYKWNGSSWTSASTLPDKFGGSSAVVYNNEIHILGGLRSQRAHYKWDGSSWTSVSTLPYLSGNCSAVVYNNEIHILGSGYGNNTARPYSQYHYKWNGSSWTDVSTLPYEFFNSSAVVYDNKINLLGSAYKSSTDASINNYKKFMKLNNCDLIFLN